MRFDLAVLVVTFVATTLVALALGAPNTAQAATYGTIAFALAVVVLIVRRP